MYSKYEKNVYENLGKYSEVNFEYLYLLKNIDHVLFLYKNISSIMFKCIPYSYI